MIKISDFYEEIGTFESQSGDPLIINKNLILSVFNAQLTELHPLNKLGEIGIIDYCYFVFHNVTFSKRKVSPCNESSLFEQINYVDNQEKNNHSQKIFIIETIDFKNNSYVYWDWKIQAEKFSLIVSDSFKINIKYWDKVHFNVEYFQKMDNIQLENILQML